EGRKDRKRQAQGREAGRGGGAQTEKQVGRRSQSARPGDECPTRQERPDKYLRPDSTRHRHPKEKDQRTRSGSSQGLEAAAPAERAERWQSASNHEEKAAAAAEYPRPGGHWRCCVKQEEESVAPAE